MKGKKQLLFVQESLTLAGGEKSLIALLSNLNPNKYDIDLQLFKYGGELDKFIPGYVNVLPPLAYTQYTEKSWKNNFSDLLKLKEISFFKSKVSYSLSIRKGKFNHPEKAQLYWECARNAFEMNPKEYDVAIAYAQGIPTFYTIDKVRAKRKIAWVNVNPHFKKKSKLFNHFFYNEYHKIVTVSAITEEQFRLLYPEFKLKLLTIPDIIDYQSILKMCDFFSAPFNKTDFNILTVARLNDKQKGYDITLEACKILKEKGIHFHWYALGEGAYRLEMEKYIKENQLENYFTLLGTNSNPYPYFNAADLYVQTSRHEGYGLSIAEARLLNIPIVTTRFDTVAMQMIHEKNGLITELNPEAVAEGIIRIMNDKALYKSIKEYLKNEPKENLEPVKKFDKMIGE